MSSDYHALLTSRPFAESMREGRKDYNKISSEFESFKQLCESILRNFGVEITKTLSEVVFEVVADDTFVQLQLYKDGDKKKKKPIPLIRANLDKFNIRIINLQVLLCPQLTNYNSHDIESFIASLKAIARSVQFVDIVAICNTK